MYSLKRIHFSSCIIWTNPCIDSIVNEKNVLLFIRILVKLSTTRDIVFGKEHIFYCVSEVWSESRVYSNSIKYYKENYKWRVSMCQV